MPDRTIFDRGLGAEINTGDSLRVDVDTYFHDAEWIRGHLVRDLLRAVSDQLAALVGARSSLAHQATLEQREQH